MWESRPRRRVSGSQAGRDGRRRRRLVVTTLEEEPETLVREPCERPLDQLKEAHRAAGTERNSQHSALLGTLVSTRGVRPRVKPMSPCRW